MFVWYVLSEVACGQMVTVRANPNLNPSAFRPLLVTSTPFNVYTMLLTVCPIACLYYDDDWYNQC